MKLQLNESGLRNIKQLAKEYNDAWIYGHIDLDGITSSLVMKYYLAQYGIKTSNWIPIQYGALEYSIPKVPAGVLGVLVDFSHGKIQFKIHTDHHETQIAYPNQSKQFAHSKSNADTISSVISPSIIMSPEDMRVVNMVDSAGYSSEGIPVTDIKNYVFNYKKDSSNKENQLKFGMVVNKLLLAYKNKPGYLKSVVLESKPSLLSMYNVMMNTINQHIKNGDKGWSDPQTLQKNSEWYREKQKENILNSDSKNTIDELNRGKNAVIGNCVVQVGGGLMNKTGSYDRYTAFDLHPDCQYFIMIWDTIGMMQVCTNNWNPSMKDTDVDLGQLVLKNIFESKYKPLLDKPKYDISLLAIKKLYEENITSENELEAIGFDMSEFKALLNQDFDLTEKQQSWLNTVMGYKPSQLAPNDKDTEKQLEYKFKCCKFLNTFKLPLSEIILKTSGGHKTITNLNGFGFLNEQQRINRAIKEGRNPYVKSETSQNKPASDKKDENKKEYESTSLKILKSIAKDVVNALNKKIMVESDTGNLLNDSTQDFEYGDQFLFKRPYHGKENRVFTIIQTRKIGDTPEAYVLEDESGMCRILWTKARLLQYVLQGHAIYMPFETDVEDDAGNELDESLLKENYTRDAIPENPPNWGYDCVFSYDGFDFTVEALVDSPDDKYYSVAIYKSDIEDNDDAWITNVTFDTWDEVVEFAKKFRYTDENIYRRETLDTFNGKEEPDWDGDF